MLVAACFLGVAAALAPEGAKVARRAVLLQAPAAAAVFSGAVLASADEAAPVELPPSTNRMGGALEKFSDVNRGFRVLKPTTWNQFEGETSAQAGAYDFRWVDVVSAVDSITVSTSSYGGGGNIGAITSVDKLGAKLAGNRGPLLSARARVSDGLLFYDYEFNSSPENPTHEVLTMTVNKNRLWQISAKSPEKNWAKKGDLYKNVVASFVPKL